jgi:hypothetical protein
LIVFYISGHGFGHAARAIEVINILHERAPDLRLEIVTSAPPWLFDVTLRAPVERRSLECDPGIVQVDSLTVDVGETVHQAKAFYATFDARAAAEAEALRRSGGSLVVGDIPPLAFAAAHLANVPSVAIGNFTWDWIYEGYQESASLGASVLDPIRQAYARADLALRLPLHGGFAPFSNIRDVPLIARRSRRTPGELRERFDLPRDTRLVLPAFGGYGLRQIDVSALGKLDGYTVVITSDLTTARRDREVTPATGSVSTVPRTVRLLDERTLYTEGYRYEDLVAAVDVVATKPGYSIIAECAANGAAILYTSRGHFIEYDVLVREMPQYVRCEFISNAALTSGRWQEALDRLMLQEPIHPRPDVTGAQVVADVLIGAAQARAAVSDRDWISP